MISEHIRQVEGGVSCVEFCDDQALVRDPLASVMMITYNHEPYLRQAIESILAQQTDFPFELVIGEDHSPDRTREIAMEYANRHANLIRVITSDTNVGARRNGWRTHWSCRGKYLAWCEGDDYWHDPLKLQKQVDMLEADEEIVLVHTDLDFLYQEKQVRVPRFHHRRGFRFDETLSRQQRFEAILLAAEDCYTPTVCYRLSIMKEIMRADPYIFQETYFPMGDTPKWLELALRGRFGYIDESTATFRRIAESSTRGKDYRRLSQFTLKGMELRLYYKQKYGADEASFNRLMDRMGMRALYQSCLAGDPEPARRLRELFPNLNWTNRLLSMVAESPWLNGAFRSFVWLPLALRRKYRRFRYGIESSI